MNIRTFFRQKLWILKILFRQKLWILEPFSARNYEYWNLFPPEIMNIGTFFRQKFWILEPFTARNYEYWNHFNERNYEYWTPAFWCKERILRNPIVFGYRKVKTRQYKKFKKDYNYWLYDKENIFKNPVLLKKVNVRRRRKVKWWYTTEGNICIHTFLFPTNKS